MHMTTSEKDVQSIIESLEQQERRARQRAFWYAALPVLLAALLVGYSAMQIQKLVGVQAELRSAEKKLITVNSEYSAVVTQAGQAQEALVETKSDLTQVQADYEKTVSQLDGTNQKLEQATLALKEAEVKSVDLQKQVDVLNRDLQFLTDQLAQASTFKRFAVDIREEQIKDVQPPLPDSQLSLLYDMFALRYDEVHFSPKGNSVEEGFDSPRFVVFMMQKHGLLPDGYDPGKLPWEQLSQTRQPENGDLVFYQSGYTMFYFKTPVEFVMGMTPVGILTLRPDFAPILGYLKVNYP